MPNNGAITGKAEGLEDFSQEVRGVTDFNWASVEPSGDTSLASDSYSFCVPLPVLDNFWPYFNPTSVSRRPEIVVEKGTF